MSLLRRLHAGAILLRANTVPFERPDRLPRAMLAMAPWGASLGGLVAGAAARYPDRTAVTDGDRSTSYRELAERAARTAAALIERGVRPETSVGLLCRNHVGFVEWLVAGAMTGADVVLLNTGFAGPQLADVIADERIAVVIHDDEFAGVVAECDVTSLDESAMRRCGDHGPAAPPRREQGRLVILTSGTTGRPKGASRGSDPAAVVGVAAVLDRIPFRLGDTQVIAAPLFHAWGLSNVLLGIGRCATNVVARKFDAEATLRAVADNEARVLVVVPVMLARMLALPPSVLDSTPVPQLQIIASSGSAIGSRLASEVLDRFGPVLYNLYGSTEVAVATIATPADLQVAPATAGRVALGVNVEILDDAGSPVAPGKVGRIFVGGAMRFEGYTNGGGKEERRGLLSSGDLGRFEGELLFVEGREDDMIVSGGENVFPVEVEELLGEHPGVAEAVVIGVPDAEFGEVLGAFVVRRSGAELREDEVRTYVRDRLARHKVPRHVVVLDDLPRNSTGKVLRRSLRDMLSETGSSS